ncbi:hypothetical protein [Acerihabitans sp.]|uniref:hypothetical protein n=1 Tax=Acerihabitans sp. TaxID=2811394 RepID=UPI002ED8B9B2
MENIPYGVPTGNGYNTLISGSPASTGGMIAGFPILYGRLVGVNNTPNGTNIFYIYRGTMYFSPIPTGSYPHLYIDYNTPANRCLDLSNSTPEDRQEKTFIANKMPAYDKACPQQTHGKEILDLTLQRFKGIYAGPIRELKNYR